MLESLGTLLVRRVRRVLALCAVLVTAAAVFGGPVVGLLDAEDDFDDPATESIRAHDARHRLLVEDRARPDVDQGHRAMSAPRVIQTAA